MEASPLPVNCLMLRKQFFRLESNSTPSSFLSHEAGLWSLLMTLQKLTILHSGIVVFFCMSVALAGTEASSTGDVLIENIRIIDGKGNAPSEAQDVLVAKGKIARVADHGEFETAAEVKRMDGESLTLMPGLIDAHSHIFFSRDADWRKSLKEILFSGITSVNTLGGVLELEIEAKEILANSDEPFSRVSVSGYLQDGVSEGGKLPDEVDSTGMILYLKSNQDVVSALDRHQAAGIRMVKAYMQLPLRRLEFFVDEAHKREMRVVIDASRAIGTVAVNRTGVDGYAHQPWHFPASPEEIEDAKQRGIWFLSTLNVFEFLGSTERYPLADEVEYLITEPLVAPFYEEEQIRTASSGLHSFINGVKNTFIVQYGERYNENADRWFEISSENTRRLVDAGILVGMGTDTTGHWALRPPGWLLHYEMELWNQADIAPIKAIQAATYNNARILEIDDKTGSISEGLEADLLIVAGNPAANIRDTRNIRYVFLDGKLVDRQSLVLTETH